MSSAFGARATVAIAVLLAPSSAMAQASAPADQRPKWAVQIAPGECTLLRTTGGSEPSLLRLKTKVGTERYWLALAGKDVRAVSGMMPEQVELRVDGKVAAKRFGSQSNQSESGFNRLYHVSGIAREAIDAVAKGETLEVRASSGKVATISMASGAKAFAAFRTCEADQLIEWGADPAQFEPGGSAPVVKDRDQLVPQELFRQIKTSGRSIQPEHQLMVSTQGVVERCAATYGIPDSNMEQVVCTYLTGRKIGEPARDPSGKPVRGVVTVQPARILTAVIRN
jgi:hypothetical protein